MESYYLLVGGLFFASPASGTGTHVCGYRAEWNASHSTITYMDTFSHLTNQVVGPLDTETGVFTSPERGSFTFTVVATVGGMLPPKPGDLLLIPSPVYGQIFVKHNGKLINN